MYIIFIITVVIFVLIAYYSHPTIQSQDRDTPHLITIDTPHTG